jgi:cellulose synthase/poly-beta-1,6-N-acetylglucosamine synthase-like glycosyltransferase
VIRALALGAVAGFGHVLYPLWLWATARSRPGPAPGRWADWPGVTFVVPAYREANIIGRKLADLESQDYPGERQIVVVADDPETAAAARLPGVEVLVSASRGGKAAALNRGFEAAHHPVVVISDANAMLEPGTTRALVAPLADPEVGAVAGEKRVADGGGEALYWAFEAWLKRLETARGSTIGLVGELAAIRRSAYRPIPTDLAVDDLWIALDVIEDGFRVVYEPDAVATEEPNESWREDWERRTRVVSGALDIFVRRPGMLGPRSPVAAELWGHKVVRSSAGPLAHLLLLLRALRRAGRSPIALAFVLAHLFAAQALARRIAGQEVTRLERIAAQVLFLQGVGLGGLWRYARGDRPALWPKLER